MGLLMHSWRLVMDCGLSFAMLQFGHRMRPWKQYQYQQRGSCTSLPCDLQQHGNPLIVLPRHAFATRKRKAGCSMMTGSSSNAPDARRSSDLPNPIIESREICTFETRQAAFSQPHHKNPIFPPNSNPNRQTQSPWPAVVSHHLKLHPKLHLHPVQISIELALPPPLQVYLLTETYLLTTNQPNPLENRGNPLAPKIPQTNQRRTFVRSQTFEETR